MDEIKVELPHDLDMLDYTIIGIIVIEQDRYPETVWVRLNAMDKEVRLYDVIKRIEKIEQLGFITKMH